MSLIPPNANYIALQGNLITIIDLLQRFKLHGAFPATNHSRGVTQSSFNYSLTRANIVIQNGHVHFPARFLGRIIFAAGFELATKRSSRSPPRFVCQ